MKKRVVELKGVDLLYWVIVWTGAIGVATVLSYFIGEPLMPYAHVCLGGITLAEMIWICEFALPYLAEKWKLRRRGTPRSPITAGLISAVGAYRQTEIAQAAVDKLFSERRSGKIAAPSVMPRLPLDSAEHSELFEEVRDKPELWTETVLYKIGRNNVAVNCFLNLQARGDLSHEQALVGSVLYLCEENRRLMNQVKEFYWKFPGPLPFPKDVKAPAEGAGKEKG